jgi:hypothetical protein
MIPKVVAIRLRPCARHIVNNIYKLYSAIYEHEPHAPCPVRYLIIHISIYSVTDSIAAPYGHEITLIIHRIRGVNLVAGSGCVDQELASDGRASGTIALSEYTLRASFILTRAVPDDAVIAHSDL